MEFTEEDFISMPDVEIGRQLIGRWVAYHVLSRDNINHTTEEQRTEMYRNIFKATQHIDTDEVHKIILEKALKKAVSGEFATAGKILRDWVNASAFNLRALNEALTGSMRQSKNAKKPRPKKKPTNRNLTMEEMKKWRNDNHTFEEFREAAQNGSIDDFELQKGTIKYEVSWSETKTQKVSFRTLEDWWTDCQKPSS